ncbi:MAG: hypothetical protein J6O88_05755 [Chryseobacterium sp.]|uniref:hypothetical protein n=1 Tax=Chryseobacterium sp. TaxID=1871047 RepID=UPI001B123AF5|nr:hypothetical protein [Chryseobacterium sp.]MBO6184187.1 hypothetical protein [Chryseobacterium sp.]
MEEVDKKNIFIEFGRSSKTSIGELIISEGLLKSRNLDVPNILFEETTKVEREKMLGLREVSYNYPPDYLSARSLAWTEASKYLPLVLKIIHENERVSPFNKKH